jgi:hypothetical protein
LYSSSAWFQDSTSAESSQISSWVAAVSGSILSVFRKWDAVLRYDVKCVELSKV